eukprot:8622982-Pyramimonas_sp.AAC.1
MAPQLQLQLHRGTPQEHRRQVGGPREHGRPTRQTTAAQQTSAADHSSTADQRDRTARHTNTMIR